MADSMNIQGPIEIKDNSAERVAYDLMLVIAHNENGRSGTACVAKEASNRLYYLTLYAECLTAVKHRTVPESDSSLV
ncbi:hypothetical protein [Psychrobacter sp. BF1]|uniref:hypothetical protein n=1 Tax=Psychrobacter sp. BF1 TaxID=2821147 RepID=UPI001C4E2BCD|nr:hypothetical protein [Psychrobacter sp. BF1]